MSVGAMPLLLVSVLTLIFTISAAWMIGVGIMPNFGIAVMDGHVDNVSQHGVEFEAVEIYAYCIEGATAHPNILAKMAGAGAEARESIRHSMSWACEYSWLAELVRWLPMFVPAIATIVLILKAKMAASVKGAE